jgi:hypothetical protein
MTAVLIAIIVVLVIALAALTAVHFGFWSRRATQVPASGSRRILFPFVASALSSRALDAALRLARAEDATLVPVFLAQVPLHLPLGTPLPRQGSQAIPLQEAIEQRASSCAREPRTRSGRPRNPSGLPTAASRADVVVAPAMRLAPTAVASPDRAE